MILQPATPELAGRATTSADVADALPDANVARDVDDFFRRAGFVVGPRVATSFSISGPLEAFAATFGSDPSAIEQVLQGDAEAAELDLSNVPSDVDDAIAAVVVTARPAFGPGNP